MTLRSNGRPRSALNSSPAGAADGYPLELEEARRVQQHLLLSRAPPLPGWDVAAACRPARLLSGDYCDLFEAGAGRLALALGDVCGKGLGPALVAAGLRAWSAPGCRTGPRTSPAWRARSTPTCWRPRRRTPS
jgi:hypothetical protein